MFIMFTIYKTNICVLQLVKAYNELSGVRDEKTSSSEMEATYALRCWQRWRDVLVAEVLNGAMNRTRPELYASRNLSGIFL